MHRVLRIPDTLSLIFPHITSQQNLANCAVVCQAWFDPAIETLWTRALYSDLCRIFLAAGLLEVIEPGGVYSTPKLIDATDKVPCEKGWDRFYRYSRKIRTLGFHTETRFTPQSLQFLLRPLHAANSSLFPLGRVMKWEVYDRMQLQLCIFLLHHMPQVIKLSCEIKCSKNSLAWEDLGAVLQKCTKLESFRIRPFGDSKNVPHIFQALANLPRLKEIRGSYVSVEGNSIGPGTFSELESIWWTRPMDLNFFRGPWFPPPNLFTLTSSLITANSLREIVILLSWRKSLLHTLTADVVDDFDSTHVRAISTLHLLQELNIQVENQRLYVTEEDIGLLAASLPKLKVLVLTELGLPRAATLSHTSVECLINHCPDIEKIHLPFDASRVPPTSLAQWKNRAHLEKPQTRLEIDPGQSGNGSPVMIATWLQTMCYEKNKTPEASLDCFNTIWLEVWKLLAKPEGILELLE